MESAHPEHHHQAHHHVHDSQAAAPKATIPERIKSQINLPNALFLLVALVIAILAIHYRTTMLNLPGFYEPDGFYYFTAMRAIVNNGFQFPAVLGISGYPQHRPIAEAHGIYYLTLIPYFILGGSVSYYTIMRMLPVVFALLELLTAYLLSRYISKDKLFGLLVIFFIALSMGNAARTSALVYRGDSFVSLFLIIALIFFVETIKQVTSNGKLKMSVLAGLSLLLANLVWNGAPFAAVIFIFSFIILTSYAFIFRKEKLIDDSKYFLLSLAVWFIMVNFARFAGIIPGQQLTDLSFVPIYAGLVALWAFSYYLTTVRIDFTGNPLYRFGTLASIMIIGLGIFAILQPTTIYTVFVGNGFVSAPGSFGSTTQELQSPTCQFLLTSFGPSLFTALPNLFILFTSTTGWFGCPSGTTPGAIQSIWTGSYGIIGIILLVILFLPYLFLQVYDSEGFVGGKPKLKFDLTSGMTVLMAYFIVTAYLEMHVIRFNALLSIPLAMLSAFTIYWLIIAANNFKFAYPTGKYVLLILLTIALLYVAFKLISNANFYSQALVQADSINPQFLSALQWLKANSPSNSVVVTLWPDGSVVEAIANRTSVMDSVGSENGTKAGPFAAWLLNDSPDPQFLTTPTLMGSPNYVLVRTSWLIETQGIYTEANITTNASEYGYLPLTSFSEATVNSTFKQLVLRTNPNSQYPAILINMGYSSATNTLDSIYSLLEFSQSQNVPFGQVVLYNQNNGNFTYLNESAALNKSTNGETLLLQYSNVPRSGFFFNVTGAFVFAPGIANSNMIKLIYLCSATQCLWNNKLATAQQVYMNQDTRIFKITYLNSSS